MPQRLGFIALMSALLLVACGQSTTIRATPTFAPRPTRAESRIATPTTFSSPVSSLNQPGPGTPKPSPLTQSTLPSPDWPAGADAAVRAAINDLAARLKIAPENVQVASVQAVDWPDTSLGCPKPGMFYAQVITLGYKIVLSAEGKQVEYHADKKGRVVTCQ
jgi:hypothetical protein